MYKKDGINDCDQACARYVLHLEDVDYVFSRLAGEYGRSGRRLNFSGLYVLTDYNFAILFALIFYRRNVQRADSISNYYLRTLKL